MQDRLNVTLESTPLTPMRRMIPGTVYNLRKILIPLDGSDNAEACLPAALKLSRKYGAAITLLSVISDKGTGMDASDAEPYLRDVTAQISGFGEDIAYNIAKGDPAEEIVRLSNEARFDLVVMTTFGKTPPERMLSSVVTYNVIFKTTPPLLLVRPIENWRCRRSDFKKILVPLDGSPFSEQCIPFAEALALRFHSEVWLLSVPEEEGNTELKSSLEDYLTNMMDRFEQMGIPVQKEVSGSGPARTILGFAETEGIDLIVLASHGSGGVDRQDYVKLGSTVDRVISMAPCPVFFVSSTPIEKRT